MALMNIIKEAGQRPIPEYLGLGLGQQKLMKARNR
jgi:hypothetical protein